MKKDNNIIELQDIAVKHAEITIVGNGDIVLNKMNARSARDLIAKQNGQKVIKQTPNPWEDIATSITWRDSMPVKDTYNDMTEEIFMDMLRSNAPCISGFGLKKSFGQAVVRNEVDTYSTKFDNAVNVNASKIPITFGSWSLDERLMSPKKGSPVVVRLNHFSNWSATFGIDYTNHVFTLDQIVNIINLAGFGLGIGSGRSSGYGRYHITEVEA